ncbi:histidine phosphatase family protein [Sphingomonas sp. JC676]|uniref:histidine phosphatase family protein n=1 Tax=Sphingomonas sp. JC676 TaxID=2768065 RepID=UPI001658646D|nr:histidine phosphatase family protein [Sphingomonas sp. JC676]MBC9031344.1 histidine phosphatase family protein [Sphingomonas sp. JC676]
MTDFALHLLRHGAPEIAGRMLGRTDIASTAGGIAACVEQAGALGIQAIVTSDLRRASSAAEAIGAALALSVTVDARWRELDFGDWDGLASNEIDAEALGRFWNDPDAFPAPNGERWSALVARVSAAIADLTPRPTLVVTHGGAMRAALATLCGFDQRQLWAFELPYAALLSLRVWPGEPRSAQIAGLWP